MLRRITRVLGSSRRRLRIPEGRAGEVQSGAVPYAWVDDEPAYLLITSRRTRRWIFPKGAVAHAMTAQASAAKEAWEEAGVRGEIGDHALGRYHTEKVDGRRRRWIAVELYPLLVTKQAEDWPERRGRRRHWATHRQARRLIDNPELVALLDHLHARLKKAGRPTETADAPPRGGQPRKRSSTK